MKTLLIILIGLMVLLLISQSQLESKSAQKLDNSEDQLDGYENSNFNKRSSFNNKYSQEISSKDHQERDLIVQSI